MNDVDVINIDSRSHLEVADVHHRYSKNLRLYFKEYSRIFGSDAIVEQISNSSAARKWSRYDPFFKWLDNEYPKPELLECPRLQLDSDVVLYLKDDVDRQPFEIEISPARLLCKKVSGEPVSTGPKGWIFVLKHSRMFACEKRTATYPRLQHSSFFSGDVVNAAGMIVCVDGVLVTLYPHSGHYRPMDRHLCSLLRFLHFRGLPLADIQVDVQRIWKASRPKDQAGSKLRKTECALFSDAAYVYAMLCSRQEKLRSGLLQQIQSGVTLRHCSPRLSSMNAALMSYSDPPSLSSSPFGSQHLSSFLQFSRPGVLSTPSGDETSSVSRARVLSSCLSGNASYSAAGTSGNYSYSSVAAARDVALLLGESPMVCVEASSGSPEKSTNTPTSAALCLSPFSPSPPSHVATATPHSPFAHLVSAVGSPQRSPDAAAWRRPVILYTDSADGMDAASQPSLSRPQGLSAAHCVGLVDEDCSEEEEEDEDKPSDRISSLSSESDN